MKIWLRKGLFVFTLLLTFLSLGSGLVVLTTWTATLPSAALSGAHYTGRTEGILVYLSPEDTQTQEGLTCVGTFKYLVAGETFVGDFRSYAQESCPKPGYVFPVAYSPSEPSDYSQTLYSDTISSYWQGALTAGSVLLFSLFFSGAFLCSSSADRTRGGIFMELDGLGFNVTLVPEATFLSNLRFILSFLKRYGEYLQPEETARLEEEILIDDLDRSLNALEAIAGRLAEEEPMARHSLEKQNMFQLGIYISQLRTSLEFWGRRGLTLLLSSKAKKLRLIYYDQETASYQKELEASLDEALTEGDSKAFGEFLDLYAHYISYKDQVIRFYSSYGREAEPQSTLVSSRNLKEYRELLEFFTQAYFDLRIEGLALGYPWGVES